MAMLSFSISSIFLQFTLLFHRFPTHIAAQCHPDDEAGLLAFKAGITADPSGMLNTWQPGTDCCGWDWLSCGGPNGRVNLIYIRGNTSLGNSSMLSGTISPLLSKLHCLDSFLLRDLINLTAPFPNFLFRLPYLYTVYIKGCNLSGPIPKNIGDLTKLMTLTLARNQFSGGIPSSVNKLTLLTTLDLSGNRLSGTIPSSIKQLTKLYELNLGRNRLYGIIPDIFSALPNLQLIRLSNNNFTGAFPQSISHLNPVDIDLAHNSLTGQIPDFIGNFSIMKTLNLSWNQFSGVVPQSMGHLQLESLDLSHNNLIDPFPEMPFNQILDLSYNNFHFGDIPKWFTESSSLTSLSLAKCGINITLAEWEPHLPFLYEYIDLSHNEIRGSPVSLLNISSTISLVTFKAPGNKLRFNMKSVKIGKKSKLKVLDLSHNLVFGNVPKSVSRLEELNVSFNHLCGRLPETEFPASAFAGNDCLCGAPLPPCKNKTKQQNTN